MLELINQKRAGLKLAKEHIKFVDRLFMSEVAYDAILGFIDIVISPNKPSNRLEEFKQSLVRIVYRNSIDIVFKYAESPIEKIFLNALLLTNLMHGPYLILYTEPLSPVSKALNELRAGYELVMGLMHAFEGIDGEIDIEKFNAYVLDSSTFTEEDQKFILHHVICEYGLKHSNAFHISLQCLFDDIQVDRKHIRPDIFIWVPSRPEFKLIVECDGYQYHSNNHSFTNDRERDRILRSRGYQVLRFSGQEIISNPLGKAEELMNYLWKHRIENQ